MGAADGARSHDAAGRPGSAHARSCGHFDWESLAATASRLAAAERRRRGPRSMEAEDLAQQAMVALWGQVRDGREVHCPSAWLGTVIRRMAATRRRLMGRRPAPSTLPAASRHACGGAEPAEAAAGSDLHRTSLFHVRASLTQPYLSIALLQYVYGRTRREIHAYLRGWARRRGGVLSEEGCRWLVKETHRKLRQLPPPPPARSDYRGNLNLECRCTSLEFSWSLSPPSRSPSPSGSAPTPRRSVLPTAAAWTTSSTRHLPMGSATRRARNCPLHAAGRYGRRDTPTPDAGASRERPAISRTSSHSSRTSSANPSPAKAAGSHAAGFPWTRRHRSPCKSAPPGRASATPRRRRPAAPDQRGARQPALPAPPLVRTLEIGPDRLSPDASPR